MNLIHLQEMQEDNFILSDIKLVMKHHKERSMNTYNSYMRHYREFSDIVYGKNLQWLTGSDVEDLNYRSMLSYRDELMKNNNNNTVNIKLSSINSLLSELVKLGYDIDISAMNLNPLPNREDNSYGSLTEDEMNNLLSYCMSLPERQKPLIKKLFFQTAYITAIRTGALMKMTWDNIIKKHIDGVDLYIIKLIDKGKETQTPIPKELYIDLKSIKNDNDDRVFFITRKTLSNTLKNYCNDCDIDESRNIVLHSIKKASIDKVYSETGDINVTARHGHHNSVEMVYKHYQGMNEGLLDRPSINVFDKSECVDYERYSKDDLIDAINNLSSGSKRELNRILNIEKDD